MSLLIIADKKVAFYTANCKYLITKTAYLWALQVFSNPFTWHGVKNASL